MKAKSRICILSKIDPDRFGEIQAEVDAYLKSVINGSQGHFSTIVAVDRKGRRIMQSFFRRNPGLKGITLVSDNDFEQRQISGKRVLVFDDSIHTGSTIIESLKAISACKPSEIAVGCLLVNYYSRRKILSKFKRVQIVPCKPTFRTYSEQEKTYLSWEITYLDGLMTKSNPDCSELVMVCSCLDIKKVFAAFDKAVRDTLRVESSYMVNSRIKTPGHRSVTYLLKKESSLIHTPYRDMCDHDLPKMRCFVTVWNNETEIVIMPLINPRFRTKGCRIPEVDSKLCPRVTYQLNNPRICKVCVAYMVNWAFTQMIEERIKKRMKSLGVLVLKSSNRPPAFKRLYV